MVKGCIGNRDVRYMDTVQGLQQRKGKCIGYGTITSTGDGTCRGTGVGAQDMDYCLTVDGLVKFRDMIYLRDKSEIKKVILREFHAKPYLGHQVIKRH